jgi:hypothetical protein
MQQLADVGLQRNQVRRVLHVAADRQRAGDVLVDQPERSAEQVDARGNNRRPDAGIVEDQRLDEIVDVAAVVRRVDDAPLLRGVDGQLLVLADALDLAQDGVERVLEGAIQLVALRGLQLLEIGHHARARGVARQAMAALEKTDDVFPGEDGFSDRVWPHYLPR